MGGGAPVIEQDGFRWYDDDNTDEDATTALAAEDASYEVPLADRGTSLHLRVEISNTGDKIANDSFTLQYNKDSGGYNTVTTTSSNVRVIAGQPTDGAATANRLTSGQGTFTAGEYDDADGSCDVNLPDAEHTEFVWSIEFRTADNSGGESYTFRILYSGATVTENQAISATVQSDANVATLPSTALTLTNNAPSAVTTEKHISTLTSATLTLTNNAPQAVSSDNNFSTLPSATITLTNNAPQAVTTDNNFSTLPSASVTLEGNAPSAEATEHHLSQPPDTTLTLTNNAPQTVVTEKHISVLPSGTLTLTNNAPLAVVAQSNSSVLPSAPLTVTANNPQSITTEKHIATLPSASLTVTANAPQSVTTEKHISTLPSASITLAVFSHQAVTSEGGVSFPYHVVDQQRRGMKVILTM